MDAFAALFAQALALQCQAQTAGTTGAASTSTGTTGVQSTATSGQTAISSDLGTLSQALSGGNLAAARQAFQSLQNDLQNDLQGAQQTHHHHHHHHSWATAQSGQDGQGASTSGTGTTTGSIGASTAS